MYRDSAQPSSEELTTKQLSNEDARTALDKALAELCEIYKCALTETLSEIWEKALSGFTQGMVERGLRATLRNHEDFMPTPAQFRKYYRADAEAENFAGIGREHYPEVSPDERAEALEYSERLKETLAKKDEELKAVYNPPRFDPVSSEAFEGQLERYRVWLAERVEQDRSDKAVGRLPIPRSEAERLAMFLSLPQQERRRLARSKEWTKVRTT